MLPRSSGAGDPPKLFTRSASSEEHQILYILFPGECFWLQHYNNYNTVLQDYPPPSFCHRRWKGFQDSWIENDPKEKVYLHLLCKELLVDNLSTNNTSDVIYDARKERLRPDQRYEVWFLSHWDLVVILFFTGA